MTDGLLPQQSGRPAGAFGLRQPGRVRATAACLALGLGLALGLAGPAAAQPSPAEAPPIDLAPSVKQGLVRLQEQWLQWLGAFQQGNRERADGMLANLLATSRQLGIERLRDISLGAVAQAVQAAREGEVERAWWALESAEILDPNRPETAFARATVARLEGDYVRALGEAVGGQLRLLRSPVERTLWLGDLLLWFCYTLLVSGALFIALQMAAKGPALYQDLAAFLARFLPDFLAYPAGLGLLLWPLLLPAGLLWLIVYWSVLLWGYGSATERGVVIAIWLFAGVAPILTGESSRRVEVVQSPPMYAAQAFAQGRLYGDFFNHLGALKAALPESGAVRQLLADVYRTLGQWERARALYNELDEATVESAPVLVNLGAFFYYNNDFGTAIRYFQQATEADPGNAAAFYNLSQAYSAAYSFDQSRQALEKARAIDPVGVTQWIERADEGGVLTLNGSVARLAEIRRELLAARDLERGRRTSMILDRTYSLVLAAAAILLALVLHLMRRRTGYSQPPIEPDYRRGTLARLGRACLPGLTAAEMGEGGKAFLALLLPVALLLLPQFEAVGYRLPLGYVPGKTLAWAVAIVGLAVYLGIRLRRELLDRI